jgi:hypothetical protein
MRNVRSFGKNNLPRLYKGMLDNCYKSKKQLDLEFGELGERLALPILDTFFGGKHLKSASSHDRWDYIVDGDPSVRRELKSRRIRHNEYETAILNHSKILNQDPNIKYTYIWHYTDGWYYLPYDANVWTNENGFVITMMNCWRDGRCESQPVINIPHRHLIKINV